MSHRPIVLVLGARGRFGQAAAHAFAAAGWQVVGQVRPGATGLVTGPGIRWLHAHPADTATLARQAAGASVVVQGLSPVDTHRAWRRDLPGLTQAAIDATRALRATLMLPASVYNFGAGMPQRLLEDTPQAAATSKGLMRIDSERMVRHATLDGAMKAVVIRAGDFFGSGRGSWLDLVMARGLRAGRFTYPGPQDVPTAWAYLPDLARSFVAVASRHAELPAFETLHFAGYRLTGRDWADAMRAVAVEQGWIARPDDLRVRRVNWPLLRAVGLVVPTVAAVCEMRYLWNTPHQLVNRRMQALAGPEPHTPFDLALRTSLAELGLLRDTADASVAARA